MNKKRLYSVMVLAALLFSFAGISPTQAAVVDTLWVGSGSGTTTVVSDGSVEDPKFTYDALGFSGEWVFSTTARGAGGHTINWSYSGLHAWFMVTVDLDAFINDQSVNLVRAGPEICCTTPSNGFSYSGTYTFNVQAGDTYGFKMRGSNFDSNPVLKGTLTLNEVYRWTGFFEPVTNGEINLVKAGSSVPVKFSLEGDQGLAVFAAGYPVARVMTCPAGIPDPIVDTETVTANASGLIYDPLAQQYVYVWKTERSWTGCRQLVVKLADGTVHTADFQFK